MKANPENSHKTHEEQNQRRAVATGFQDDTTEQEVEDLLKETIVAIGIAMDKINIKCPAKPITHAFLQFTDSDERDKYVRSANMLKKELSGRKIRISSAMDAEERFHQQSLGYIQCCIYTRHTIPIVQITMNRMTRHVSADGPIAIRTCANGSLKYHKYQDIEAYVEEFTNKSLTKNSSQRL